MKFETSEEKKFSIQKIGNAKQELIVMIVHNVHNNVRLK